MKIPYGKQYISESDITAVQEVLKADFLTQGPMINEFEEAFASYVESKYAVAVSNGTAALHLCAMALNVQPGQKVITTPITFAASANCIRYCGGEVVFADIDPETYVIDLDKVEQMLRDSPKGTYSGIVPVDFAGRPVNFERVRELCDEFDLWAIEDSCHAPGGFFKDSELAIQRCGNGAYADLAIFSFHPVKHIAAGEGGMITTNDEKLYNRLLKLRTHGIHRQKAEFTNEITLATGGIESDDYPGWYMEMEELGYNYRLTDIQCALGLSQLSRASEGILRRKEIARKYADAFESSDFIKGQSGDIEGHAYHLYIIEVEDRLGLYNHLRTNQIYAQIHYIPCHLMPYYKSLGWKEGDFPHAETYYSRCLSLPMYPTLTDEQQDFVIGKINAYYQ